MAVPHRGRCSRASLLNFTKNWFNSILSRSNPSPGNSIKFRIFLRWSRFGAYQVSCSLSCMGFLFFNKICTILHCVAISSTVGAPRSSTKRAILSYTSNLITVQASRRFAPSAGSSPLYSPRKPPRPRPYPPWDSSATLKEVMSSLKAKASKALHLWVL